LSSKRVEEELPLVGKTYKRTHTIYVIGDVAFVANPASRSCWWKTHVSVAFEACPECGSAIGEPCKPSFGFCRGNTHVARRHLTRGRDQVAMKIDLQQTEPSAPKEDARE
jgi:hypothetical protein